MKKEIKTTFLFANYKKELDDLLDRMENIYRYGMENILWIREAIQAATKEKNSLPFQTQEAFFPEVEKMIFNGPILKQHPVLFWQETMGNRQAIYMENIHHIFKKLAISLEFDDILTEKRGLLEENVREESEKLLNISRFLVHEYREIMQVTKDLEKEMENREIPGAIKLILTPEACLDFLVEADLTTAERDIIAGIYETLDIKVEGLLEQNNIFQLRIEKTLQEVDALSFDFSDEDLEAAKESMKKQLFYALLHAGTAESFGLTLHAFGEKDFSREFLEDKLQPLNIQTAQHEKTMDNFLKQELLFEVVTFEEILYYSINRLRLSMHPMVIKYVSAVDTSFENIVAMLENNQIKAIRPAAHDKFSPRKHEVLLAEVDESFHKGEIIKTINAGYERRGEILLRANVVAAR